MPRGRYIGASDNNYNRVEQYAVSGRLDHQLQDRWLLTLMMQTSRSERTVDFAQYSYGLYEGGMTYAYSSVGLGVNDAFSGELRLEGKFDALGHEHQALFGIEHREVDRRVRGGFDGIGTGNIYTNEFDIDPVVSEISFDFETRNRTLGAFGQIVARLSDRSRAVATVRYDAAEQESLDFLPTSETQAAEPDEFTWRLGLSHDFTANVTAFAGYGTSFVPVIGRLRTGELAKPESGSGFEVGLKTSWLEERLAVTVSGYRQDREDVLLSDIQVGDPGGAGFVRNAGRQRMEGLEIEIVGEPYPGWRMAFAGSWIDSEFIESTDPSFGQTTPGTVERQTNVHLSYRFASGKLEGFRLGAGVVSLGKRWAARVGQFADGYERYDLDLEYDRFTQWNLKLQIRNLTDERYLELATISQFQGYFGAPRAVLFRAEYRFGG